MADISLNTVEKATLSTGAQAATAEQVAESDVIVQHVILRRDLWEALEWPRGSVIAQGCHAAVAAIWENSSDKVVQDYCGDIDHMRKVVLEVKGEQQLLNLSEKLKDAGIVHKLWMEQPENIPTCIATKPSYKSQVATHLKKAKLCK